MNNVSLVFIVTGAAIALIGMALRIPSECDAGVEESYKLSNRLGLCGLGSILIGVSILN